MTKPHITLTPAWIAANRRAVENAGAGRRAERIDNRTYRVPSAHRDQTYTVTVASVSRREATGTCPHGSRADAKGVCWHKSAALAAAAERIAEVERAMARFSRP